MTGVCEDIMAGRPMAPRPLSPHLSIWKWRVHMLVSILHRATGNAMAFAAVLLFLWWLIAAATGPEAYATFMQVATGWFGIRRRCRPYLGRSSST